MQTGLSNGWLMLCFSRRAERDRHLISRQAIDQGGRHADWAFKGWLMVCFSRRGKRDRHLISGQAIDQGGRHVDWAFNCWWILRFFRRGERDSISEAGWPLIKGSGMRTGLSIAG
jgi:hypothetical protein